MLYSEAHSVTLFSATLSPPAYAMQLLGLPENTAWIDVPPAFPAVRIEVKEDIALTLLFDKGQSLEERIVAEQFITA